MPDPGHGDPRDNPLRAIDPRVKIGGMALLGILILRASLPEILLLTIVLAAFARWGRVPWRRLRDILRPLWPVCVLLMATHTLIGEGTVSCVTAGTGCDGMAMGLLTGIIVTWRFAALVAAAGLLTDTTTPSELVAGMEYLLAPLRFIGVPVRDLCLMASLSLRLLPMLQRTLEEIRTAQSARGFRLRDIPLRRRPRAALRPVVPLLLGAVRRADELSAAIEARGYARHGRRTALRRFALTGADAAAVLVLAGSASLCLLAGRTIHVP